MQHHSLLAPATLAIFLAPIVLILTLLHTDPTHALALRPGCTLTARLLYPFLHAGFLHALLNVYALLSLSFFVNFRQLLLAYLVAVTVPIATIAGIFPTAATPTVGLSVVIFALVPFTAPKQPRPLRRWRITLAAILILGLFLPHTAGILHLYAFLAATLIKA